MSQPAVPRHAEEELRRLNRALRMLSDSNQSLIRATDEAALLRDVCRIAVEVGGYRMAWVGLPVHDAGKSVRVAAIAGFEAGYIEAMRITWADGPHGRGPAGTAIRTGQPHVIHDLEAEATSENWRAAARARGYRAIAGLPLGSDGKTFGALSVHSADAHAFDEEEMKILTELAGDLAFGLVALRTRAEHARAEELLHQREQEFRAFVENSPDLILRFNRELRETYVNPAMCRAFGVPAEAFLNKPIGAGTLEAGLPRDPAALGRIQQCIRTVFETGAPTELELAWPTLGGNRIYSVRYFPELDRAGAVSNVLAISRDVTEHRRTELALKNVLHHARTMVMRATVTAPAEWPQHDAEWLAAHFAWDSKFDDEAGAQAVLPLAVPAGSSYEQAWNEAKLRDDHGPMALVAARALRAGEPSWHQEFRAVDRDGRLRWFAQVASVETAGSARWQVTTTNTDITSRKEAEGAMHNVLLRARAMVMHATVTAPDGWDQHEPEWSAGRYKWVAAFMNEAAAQEVMPVALAPGEKYHTAWVRARNRDDLPMTDLTAARAFVAGAPSWQQEFRATDRDGRLHWFSQSAAVRALGRGRWEVTTINTDITDRKLAEEAIRAREQEFRALAENTPDFIVRWDRERRRVYANPAFAQAMGATQQQLVGGAFGEKFGVAPPRASLDAIGAMLQRVFAEGQPAEILLPWQTVAGESFHYVRFVPEFGADGRVATVVGIGRDVTALKESEEQLRALTANSPDLIARVDREHRYLYVNRAIERMSGATAEQHIGKRVGEVTQGSPLAGVLDRVRHAIDRVFATAGPVEIEGRARLATGEIALDGRFVPEFNQQGEVASVLILARDVTERARAAEELRRSQQAYASLVTTIDGIVWEADAETFAFSFVSPQAERILGYPAARWVEDPKFWAEHLHPDDRERAIEYCVSATQAMRDHDFQYRMTAADGRLVWLHDIVTVVVEGGRAVKLRGIMLDVTKSKQAEDALRLFRTLIDYANDAIEVVDPATGRFLDVNERACAMHGYTRAEYLALHVSQVDPSATDKSWAEFSAGLQRVGARVDEAWHRRKDGTLFPIEVNVTYVRLERDYIVSILRDITERRRAQEALRASEARFRTFVDHATDAFHLHDETGALLDVNRRACEALGYNRDELIGMSPLKFDPDFTPEALAQVRARLDAGESLTFETRHQRKDGTLFPVEVRIRPFWQGTRRFAVSLAHDITERRRAEEALRESEQRFRQVTETIDEVFWMTDVAKQRMIYISPAYEKIWGQSCAHLYASPQAWLDAVHPDDRERVRQAALSMQASGLYDVEYRIVRPDRVVRWIHDRAFPIRNPEGEVARVVGVAEDITQRRLLEEQFRQSQKMEAIGQLAGGIAHDFNNLLTVVQMQTSMLLGEQRLEAGAAQSVRQIMDAATRAANLTRQLLTFSRQSMKTARAVDLGEVVTGTTKLLRRVLGEDISLESLFAPSLPFVQADSGMIEQVLMNLVLNARDAMPRGGRLVLRLDAVQRDRDENPARVGPFVRLSVSDTGSGIAPDVLPRIFEPFFTTKEVGKGTGLGLAMVFGIVQQHHGWIEVESEAGRGTTFHVFLPVIERPAELPAATAAAAPRGGHETVLLVEDEAAVLLVAALALKRSGYHVLEALNADEALALWDERDGRIDLLVTDLIMPGGMSGQQLAAELRARSPALKIIFSSGYSRESVNRELALAPGKNFLPKPYPVDELLTIVRQRLDER